MKGIPYKDRKREREGERDTDRRSETQTTTETPDRTHIFEGRDGRAPGPSGAILPVEAFKALAAIT